MDESIDYANDSFDSKETLLTLSDSEKESVDSFTNLLTSIASLFEKIIEDSKTNDTGANMVHDIFYSSHIPLISIEDYLKRIVKYSLIDSTILISAVIYIDRLSKRKPYVISNTNIYRLIIASIVLSIKFHDDIVYKNSFYGKIGGVSLQELNYLEYQLLAYLDYDLWISPETFKIYQQYLRQYTNLDESNKDF